MRCDSPHKTRFTSPDCLSLLPRRSGPVSLGVGGGVKPYNPRRAPASTSSARWSRQLLATTWASVRLQKTGSPQIRLSDTNPTRLAFLDTGHSVSVARGSYLWLDIRLHWTWTFCLFTSPLLSEVGPIPSSLRFTWNHFSFHNGKRYEKKILIYNLFII